MARFFVPSGAHLPIRQLHGLRAVALATVTVLIVAACGGEQSEPIASAEPSGSPNVAVLEPTLEPMASIDPEGLCQRIGDLELASARLQGVDLKLTNRVALDIALTDLELAFGELEDADLGQFENELETPFQRLRYRLGEVELAVEDFRTNTRPKRAAPHVQGDAATFADELAAFRVLARC
jgi:hypothetical protein